MEFDPVELNKLLDRTKAAVFMGDNAPFLGSVMCSLLYAWSTDIPTAQVDGTCMTWNPEWFLKLPVQTRKTVFVHELWHVARLHIPRCGKRNSKIWNWACDIRINNDLEDAGYTFEGTSPWKDQAYSGWVEEDIYDDLIAKGMEPPPGPEDLIYGADEKALINIVIQATHQARLGHGTVPGGVEETIKAFLTPIVPWETYLYKWMSDLCDTNRSWARPNRRYQHIYLPHRRKDEGRLTHLMYFLDVSGSITRKQIERFNSEVKYIKDTYNPAKLTIVLFDVTIRDVQVWTDSDPFDELVVTGRGGTSLHCVKDYIDEHRPTAAIIFTDLKVTPMEPLMYDIPLLWVCINNFSATVPFGEIIHIRS